MLYYLIFLLSRGGTLLIESHSVISIRLSWKHQFRDVRLPKLHPAKIAQSALSKLYNLSIICVISNSRFFFFSGDFIFMLDHAVLCPICSFEHVTCNRTRVLSFMCVLCTNRTVPSRQHKQKPRNEKKKKKNK